MSENNTLKAVIYVRVSTGKQVEGASLDTQEMLCQQWTASNGILIDKIFREEGASAKNIDHRPVMKEMLEYLRNNKGRIQYLVTYQTDRLTRNTADFFILRTELTKLGIEYKNSNSTLESNPHDNFVQTMMAAMAEFDNSLKSDRVKQSMRSLAKDGYKMGKTPHGLRNSRDILGHSTVEAIPEVAEKITTILNTYATGTHTVSSLLQLCHEIGLKTQGGKAMNLQILSNILKQPLYAGLEKSGHTENLLIESRFEGLITHAFFERNQQLLSKNKNTAAKYKKLNPLFPLRRFLKCSGCNKPLSASSPTGGSGKPSPRYHCPRCKMPSIQPQELHEQFYHLLSSLSITPDKEKFIREIVIRVWRDEIQAVILKEKKLHRELEKLSDRKKKVIDMVIGGTLSVDEKSEYMLRLDEEIQSIKKHLEKIGTVAKMQEESVEYALRFMTNAPRIWNNASIEHQTIFQKLVFPYGLEYNLGTNKFGTIRTSVLYRLAGIKKDAKAPNIDTLVTPRRVELLLPG